MPSLVPATAMMILKTDPGASCAWMALFSSGWFGSSVSSFHSLLEMRMAKSFGSKVGLLTIARIYRHERAVLAFHRNLSCLLHIKINGQLQLVSGNGRNVRVFRGSANLASAAIHKHAARSVFAHEHVVVIQLHA